MRGGNQYGRLIPPKCMEMNAVEPFENESEEKRVNEEEKGSETTFRGLKVTLGIGTVLGSFPFTVTGPGATIAFSWCSVSFLWTLLLFIFYAMDTVFFFSGLSQACIKKSRGHWPGTRTPSACMHKLHMESYECKTNKGDWSCRFDICFYNTNL